MHVGRVVGMDVEITSDHQWCWECGQQVAELVEERQRYGMRRWAINDDNRGVEPGSVNIRGNDLERREDG